MYCCTKFSSNFPEKSQKLDLNCDEGLQIVLLNPCKWPKGCAMELEGCWSG